jgi:hypothetical protein
MPAAIHSRRSPDWQPVSSQTNDTARGQQEKRQLV